jgi:hypothetical protein
MSLDWDDCKGKELRKIRLEHNLNKNDFCKRFNLSLAKLERIELGFEEPSDKIITFMYYVPPKAEAQINNTTKIESQRNKSKVQKKILSTNNISETTIKKNAVDTNLFKLEEKKIPIIEDKYSIITKDIKEEEWTFVPKNRTQLLCGVNIPENVVDYLEEAIKLNKFNHIYQLRNLSEDALIAVRADMEILLSQKKEIIAIPYEKWGRLLDHCIKSNLNWFCYGAMLSISINDINDVSDIERTYGGVVMSARSMFNKEKRECINNISSLIDFIHNYSKKYDTGNKYIKYTDRDIFELLKNIDDKKEDIYFNVYKEKNGDKSCFFNFHLIEEGYIIDINNEGKTYKYFYNKDLN